VRLLELLLPLQPPSFVVHHELPIVTVTAQRVLGLIFLNSRLAFFGLRLVKLLLFVCVPQAPPRKTTKILSALCVHEQRRDTGRGRLYARITIIRTNLQQ
jgi:hypothetical protein